MSQLVIDSRKTALVAIDLQNAVLQMNPAPHAAAEVVSNNRRISDVLRAKGGWSYGCGWISIKLLGSRLTFRCRLRAHYPSSI